ncbi:ESPR domain-containing protein [Acidaminococcus timonensis]|nr:ESPR domain-containing protein [Acidaminococcus timonensis]
MNRIFKVVWNKARNSWMVGSELISACSGCHPLFQCEAGKWQSGQELLQ